MRWHRDCNVELEISHVMTYSEPPAADAQPTTKPESLSAVRLREGDWVPGEGDWIAGTYRLEGLIGSGGLGLVFRAHDLGLRRSVAIKMLRPEMASHGELRELLIQEARRVATLRHPRIITVHSCGTHRGNPYIVMELIEGTDALRHLTAARGKLPLAEAFRIIAAIAEGLDALHEHGVVHGDVKPSNVLLGEGRVVRLTDVGFAANDPADGAIRGTAAYLSPERILGDDAPLAAPDVYALGVTAFELLTGVLPFAGGGAALLAAHVCDPSPSARAHRSELPPQVDLVLRDAMAKDPSQRPASAGELASRLASALGIRYRASESSARIATVAPPTRIRRVLVADDDADIRQLLSLSLAGAFRGCVVQAVGSGDDALEAMRYQLPDAIILDLQMPGTSTPIVCERIRSMPGGAAIPIVIVTGSGSAGDWRELKRAGADACFLKPFDLDELVATLTRRAARSQPSEPRTERV